MEIGYFISPHGYGHAARAIAVVEALQEIRPDIHCHFFTSVSKSLFEETLSNFSYHRVLVDIGLIQTSALDADFPATIDQLNQFYPLSKSLVEELVTICSNCSFITCDIAPLGIEVARLLGRPSVLVENFCWDWIYQPYVTKFPQLAVHISYLKKLFAQASYHVQTEPLCSATMRDLHCGPIFRKAKKGRSELRKQLGCGGKKLVVVTMGGVFQAIPKHSQIAESDDILLLFSGQKETQWLGKNILLLARYSEIYHPDLICAADLVVCKAGYSTIAECYQAGTRVLSVGRADFPESGPLQNYLEEKLQGTTISPQGYLNGSWQKLLPGILSQPKPVPIAENGAEQVACFLEKLLH